MNKRIFFLTCLLLSFACNMFAAKVNSEFSVKVGTKTRKYILYVPNNVKDNAPLVFSLHGASGHDTDRSPFRTSVADQKGCIVVYPQGENQNFGPFGTVPGWDATGVSNVDLDFFKAIILDVEKNYSIDRKRIYCCGFSNGGMMTYSNASSASSIFAAYASISGFQLNEFHNRHTGYRPTPFLHIHGKADDFVKYSCMPIIRDNMVARNGANPVPQVTKVTGKYTKSVYEALEGGAPYIYYEIDGMGHNDYTDRTEDGNSALTMWKFFEQYTLDTPCDKTLKWRLNLDAEGFVPKDHSWTVSANRVYKYGTVKASNNADNNVYPSLQFEPGNYELRYHATGNEGDEIAFKIKTLGGSKSIVNTSGKVGENVSIPFTVEKYGEYDILITKASADDKFTSLAIHSIGEISDGNEDFTNETPEPDPEPEDPQPQPSAGALVEIPQSQGFEYNDGFARSEFVEGKDYNTYTVTKDLQIAIKMMEVDVKNCDYVLIKFAEPVSAGWKLAFWSNQDLTDVPEGATEYKYVFAEDPKCGVTNGVLPQICMMTFFGGYSAPLVAKVEGIYKHDTTAQPSEEVSISSLRMSDKSVTKCLEDGKITIHRNGVKYNVMGTMVK